MTAITENSESVANSGTKIQEHPFNPVIAPILPQFDKMIQSYALFNLLFLVIGCVELTLLVIFFAFLAKSAILAFSLAVVFLTFFSYFILRLYFQTQKPIQFQELRKQYIDSCKSVMGFKEGNQAQHIALASACTKLADTLCGRENTFYRLPAFLNFAEPYIEKFSFWYHWNDVFKMREMLIQSAIEENIMLVKNEPTSVKAHASLANAYVTLSRLYVQPANSENSSWLTDEPLTQELESKFRSSSERAIEEFKILSDFAPDDLWVHTQLANSYHDLKMPLEELKEYEIILNLTPDDTDTMLKVGILYFEQGLNAKGLSLYEKLKTVDIQKAEALISYYGAYQPFKDT